MRHKSWIIAMLSLGAMLAATTADKANVRPATADLNELAFTATLSMPSDPMDSMVLRGRGTAVRHEDTAFPAPPSGVVPDTVPLPRPMPSRSGSPPAAPTVSYDVLGSTAIAAGHLPDWRQWLHVEGSDFTDLYEGPCQASTSICGSRFVHEMHRVTAAAARLSDAAQLAAVNTAVNHAIRYAPDSAIWGVPDFWASPADLARKGAGDCEDYAIAKLWALRALGYAANRLQLIILSDSRTRAYHAVLGVHVGRRTYILDNMVDAVAPDTAFVNYLPIMSFVADASYIHGFAAHQRRYADLSVDSAAGVPGEGD